LTNLTRREFLRLSLLSLWATAVGRLPVGRPQFPPEDDIIIPKAYGRVAAHYVNIYKNASFRAEKIGRYTKDTIVPILSYARSNSPIIGINPRWYQTQDGFIHSGHIQRFTNTYNKAAKFIPQNGQLGQVTVAYTQGMRFFRDQQWQAFYRLYFQSLHWITDIIEGPTSNQPWYEITDERLRIRYGVPAKHLRIVQPAELEPISPDVDPKEKQIQVSISKQKVTAFEGDLPVFQTSASTGVHTEGPTINGIPTDTPLGRFHIGNKMPSRHMGDGSPDPDIYAYELPGVPWNMFFVSTGVAFHGAYWHNNFGYRMSAGCVNLDIQDANWLYRWTTPVLEPDEWHHYERGTRVDVVE
jgi:lipoprotein-anchoring transpeptidase ErfK/SrfK